MANIIHSGLYTIKNVRHRNFLDLVEDRFVAGNTIAHGTGYPKTMIWAVTLLDNDNYMIQNLGGSISACGPACLSKGDVITVASVAYQWTIRESGIKGQHVIFSPTSPDLYWGLRAAQFGTHVTMQNAPTNDSNQWLFRQQEIPKIQSPGNDPTSTIIPLATNTARNMDLIETDVFGGNDSPFEKYQDVDKLAKTPLVSAISRILRMNIRFFTLYYQISVTYQLAHGEEITCLHPEDFPSLPPNEKATIEFSYGEVLIGAFGRVEGISNEFSFVILNTLTGAERVAGPFSGGHDKYQTGKNFNFRRTGRNVIAIGGRYVPGGYGRGPRLRGLTFIHRPL